MNRNSGEINNNNNYPELYWPEGCAGECSLIYYSNLYWEPNLTQPNLTWINLA
jgi:hypothetical protein